MKLVKRIDSIGVKLDELLDEYQDVFKGLGCITSTTHHIEIGPNHKPVVHPSCRVPVTLRSRVKDELNHTVRLNVIERVHKPTD